MPNRPKTDSVSLVAYQHEELSCNQTSDFHVWCMYGCLSVLDISDQLKAIMILNTSSYESKVTMLKYLQCNVHRQPNKPLGLLHNIVNFVQLNSLLYQVHHIFLKLKQQMTLPEGLAFQVLSAIHQLMWAVSILIHSASWPYRGLITRQAGQSAFGESGHGAVGL